ncbi:MAG: hypothetical protein V4613_13575 [Bacteroidota bacterium]
MRLQLNLLFIVIFFFLQSSCRDKNCNETGECPPATFRMTLEGSKNYLYADTGSWWIYKNNKTGELDTQTVRKFKFDSIVNQCHEYDHGYSTVVYDYLSRTIYSSFNKWLITDVTSSYHACSYSFDVPPTHTVHLTRTTSEGGKRYAFTDPFSSETTLNDYYSKTTYIGIDNTITLRGKTYSNVLRFQVEHDNTWFGKDVMTNNMTEPTVVYYWAKDVGIISRYNVSDNYSWELIDYKINR